MVFTTDLSDFLIPKVSEYTPDFGTMKESGGLTTKEVSENIMYPLLSQRGFSVTENSSTTAIKRDSKFVLVEPGVVLTLGTGIIGVNADIYNTSGAVAYVSDGVTQWEVESGKGMYMRYINGWISRVQEEFDVSHPVGDIYIQYGGKDFPEALYNKNGIRSTWQNISSDFEGDFFRVAGGNSASAIVTPTADNGDSVSFPRTQQNEELPNITGDVKVSAYIESGTIENSALNYKEINFVRPYIIAAEYSNTSIEFNASNSSPIYKDNGHVTPQNSGVQIWERIA